MFREPLAALWEKDEVGVRIELGTGHVRGDHVALAAGPQEPRYWPDPRGFTSARGAANGCVGASGHAMALSALYPLVLRQISSLIVLKRGVTKQRNLK